MILPILAYGDPVLKRKSIIVNTISDEIKELIQHMYQTMYHANGIGLAAPQIGKNIRLFVVDGTPVESLKESNFKKAFINPVIIREEGETWAFEEGCLSIPGIRENVLRKSIVTIQYQDEAGQSLTETYDGMAARIIQHEYDHIEGILFVDRLSALKKQVLKGKLTNISKGKTDVEYPMRFPLVHCKK